MGEVYSFCLLAGIFLLFAQSPQGSLSSARSVRLLPHPWEWDITNKKKNWVRRGGRETGREVTVMVLSYTTSIKLSGKDTPRLCVWPFGSNSDGHYCLSERDICCRRGNTQCGCHGNRQSLHFLFLNICSSATSAVQTLRKKNSLIIINTTERRVCGVTSFLVVRLHGRCAASKVKHTGAVTLLSFICSCKRTVEEKMTRFGFPTLRAATHSHPKLIKDGSVVSGLGPIGPSNSLHTMTDYDFWKVIN